MNCRVRPYRPTDREAVRRICADTGFMGKPIDLIFTDRETFADFFTRYYTDYEPDAALVAEDADSGAVVGYLLGSTRYRYQSAMQLLLLLTRVIPRVVLRFLAGRYGKESRRFLYWVVFKSAKETPPAPPRSAHFHFNLLPAYRNASVGRDLVFTFFDMAVARGVPRIYGQIQTRDNRRTGFYARYGFRELSRRRITKFERYETEPVYVSTLFKDFEES
jgi:ribosomal protein S18 acetylase RimI-like enzyme